ncbi:hypothetical protein [Bacillus sp. FJAT-50079]|uniref:hypothetical protein n=1 Tax=Bacillus sp. FJAT-50079 TaxID=2833577 RepID=UPI001BC9C6EA|nr:hypothetical protein [Bacillus sp. FJAT-50079]MBS4206776.1 hypothetical protein [Bacillus sp. FJAT-50079]
MNGKLTKLIGAGALASLLLVGCATNKQEPPPPAPTTPAPPATENNEVIEKDVDVNDHKIEEKTEVNDQNGVTHEETDVDMNKNRNK